VGGTPDAVADGVTGLLVPAGDAAAMAAALARLLDDPATARAMGEAGAARARTHYRADAVVPRLEALYQRLASGRRP
jgi:glycosyltransferase involved in cell wall biosynthesis